MARPDLEVAFVPPRTAAEEAVAETWGEVLGLDQVGVGDNFFELGGHSLVAIQVVARMSANFRVDVPLWTLFDEPTDEALALAVEHLLIDDIEAHVDPQVERAPASDSDHPDSGPIPPL